MTRLRKGANLLTYFEANFDIRLWTNNKSIKKLSKYKRKQTQSQEKSNLSTKPQYELAPTVYNMSEIPSEIVDIP